MTPPSISVIIPVKDASATLAAQLEALMAQTGVEPFEVIVADNGSADGSRAIAESFSGRSPALHVIDASGRPGAAFARNEGAASSAGDLLVFCDADDLAQPGWLAALTAAAEEADLVAGHLDFVSLNRELPYRYEPPGTLDPHLGFLPAAASANLAVHRFVFEELGGFDERHPGGGAEDVDLCWRAQLSGRTLRPAEDAVVAYRLRPTRRAVRRQRTHYGLCDCLLYREFREWGPRTDHGADRQAVVVGGPALAVDRPLRRT